MFVVYLVHKTNAKSLVIPLTFTTRESEYWHALVDLVYLIRYLCRGHHGPIITLTNICPEKRPSSSHGPQSITILVIDITRFCRVVWVPIAKDGTAFLLN